MNENLVTKVKVNNWTIIYTHLEMENPFSPMLWHCWHWAYSRVDLMFSSLLSYNELLSFFVCAFICLQFFFGEVCVLFFLEFLGFWNMRVLFVFYEKKF